MSVPASGALPQYTHFRLVSCAAAGATLLLDATVVHTSALATVTTVVGAAGAAIVVGGVGGRTLGSMGSATTVSLTHEVRTRMVRDKSGIVFITLSISCADAVLKITVLRLTPFCRKYIPHALQTRCPFSVGHVCVRCAGVFSRTPRSRWGTSSPFVVSWA